MGLAPIVESVGDVVKFQNQVAHPGQWETTVGAPDKILLAQIKCQKY